MKKTLVFSLALVAILSVTGIVIAKKNQNGNLNREGQAKHLYLYEKDSSNDWSIVDDGAWGKLVFGMKKNSEDKFVFNGHKLEAGKEYTLLSYAENWPGCNSIELGTATADEFGNIHIMGTMEHVLNDYPYGFGGDYEGVSGAKIWLVLADDKETDGCFDAWNPNEYLFESELIYKELYDYTLLSLVSKDPSTWNVVEGAYGEFHYNDLDKLFTFSGFDLTPTKQYTLLTYGGWTNIACFETEATDVDGEIYLEGDYSFELMSDETSIVPIKIWLVPSKNVNCDTTMVGWDPTSYLFEAN